MTDKDDVSRNRKDFPEDDWTEKYKQKDLFEDKLIDEDLLPYIQTEPDKKDNPMKAILKVVKRFGGLVTGLLGTGGSLVAGLDINTAILIGVTGAVAVITGDLAFAEEFKELFDKDKPEEGKR